MSATSFYKLIDALDRSGHLPAHIDGRQNGRRRLMVRCPAHDDRSPSLSVEHKHDKTLIHCFAGCEAERVVGALGLTLADLYDDTVPGAVPLKGRGTAAPRHRALESGFDARKFKVLDVARLVAEEPPEVPWQIGGLAVRGDVTVMTGDPGAGKSLLALVLGAAVAQGETIAGIGCSRGSVVYLDAENGSREIHRRLHSLGVPDTDVAVVEADGVNLRDDTDFAGLDGLVSHFGPSLLVLDSLTWRCGPRRTRRSRRRRPTLYRLKRLAERHGVAIVVLHHRPKDGGEYRGTTAIAAAAQLGFTLSKVKDDPDRTRRRLRCWKSRPAAEPEDRWLHLDAERDGPRWGRRALRQLRGAQRSPAPRRTAIVPGVLDALEAGRFGITEIATTIGADPKDGSLRRALNHLVSSEEIVRGDDKKYERCRVPSAAGGEGASTPGKRMATRLRSSRGRERPHRARGLRPGRRACHKQSERPAIHPRTP